MPETTTTLAELLASFDPLDPRDLRGFRHALPTPVTLIGCPDSLPLAFEVTVIGDIRVDVRSGVPTRRFVDMDTDEQVRTPVTVDVGGTAIGFARAAAPHFALVHVIGAMGHDHWSEFIRTSFDFARIDSSISEVEGPNSLVVVLRDQGTPENPHGVRLIVSDAETPYGQLDADRIRAHSAFIERSDALVIDGYALLEEATAEAVDVAVDLAVAAGVPVCFDIVPHRIDSLLAFERLRPFIHRSSLITTEAQTLMRLLGREVPERITAEVVQDLIDGLPPDLADWQRTWLVRYGEGNMDETSAISPSHHSVTYPTGYAQATTVTGYGYVVAAAELKWWLTNYTRAAQIYPRLAERSELVEPRRFRP